MTRVGLLVALALGVPTVTLVPTEATAEGKDKDKDKGKEKDKIQVPDSAYVKVTLTRGAKKHAHPGFRILEQEEGVFVIECDDQTHEIAVSITEVAEKTFKIHVDYIVDGNTLSSHDLEVEHTGQTEITRGDTKLTISLDPRGRQDKSRKDEDKIEDEPDDDDPLGGM